MRKILIIGIVFLAFMAMSAFAIHGAMAFSYGASCYSPYGQSEKKLGVKESIEALTSYFRERGYEVRVIRHDKRFVYADIYRGDEKMDNILMDMKTGRMRSVY